MKNQYFGDINDYFKYALLRALSGRGELRTLVAWMLTPEDGGADGRKLGYLSQPARYRGLDPELFDFLKAAVERLPRGVASIEAVGLLPNSRFHSSLLTDDISARQGYFQLLASLYAEADWVFFDPDNGFEVSSCTYGSRNSSKFLYWAELAHAYRSGLSVLVYQHFPRERRNRFIPSLQQRLADETGAPEVTAVVTPHVGFFLLPQEQHRAAFGKRIGPLVDAAGSLLRFWGPETPPPVDDADRTAVGKVESLARPLPLPVITDVSGLVARDVTGRQVLCPACRAHVFKRWPLGWDAHALRCAGVSGQSQQQRKEAFKAAWRILF